MTQLNELSGDIPVRVSHPAQATAATAESYSVLRAERALQITGARWVPNANVTGANTNNFALGLVNKGAAGSGTGVVTSVLTFVSGTNATASIATELTIGAAPTLAAGDILVLARTVNGTGLASPSGTLELTYRYV